VQPPSDKIEESTTNLQTETRLAQNNEVLAHSIKRVKNACRLGVKSTNPALKSVEKILQSAHIQLKDLVSAVKEQRKIAFDNEKSTEL